MIGIILAKQTYVGLSFYYLLIFIPLIISVWKVKKIRFILLILIAILIGIIRLQYSYPEINEEQIAFYNNSTGLEFKQMVETEWQGVVVKEPDIRNDHTKLTLQASQVLVDDVWQAINGLVLMKSNLYPEYNYGDQLEVRCNLVQPDKIEDFAYDDYLSRYDIYSLCYSPKIELIATEQGNYLSASILEFKDKVHLLFKQNINEPASSLLSAILLARKRGLSDQLLNNFSRAGVSHMIAISGMHISIISLLIVRLLAVLYLPKKVAYPIALSLLAIFIILVGAPASAVRAGMMGAIVLIADYFGRFNQSYRALIFVATATLLINPKLIIFDLGWQLSFLAVLSLIFYSPVMDKLFKRMPQLGGLTAILKTTLAAQVLTLPWIVYKFGIISVAAPVANILLLPSLPVIIIVSILAIVISFIYAPLAPLLFWLVWYILNKLIEVINLIGSSSLAVIDNITISIWFVVCLYLAIFCITKAATFKRQLPKI
ncbi:MAG: ComEC/Rec2 family competence protein [Candidatus Komeilibacteria bacterium]